MIGSYSIAPGETPESAARKRAIAESLMGQGWTARTPGQAIAQAAERIAGALIGRSADKADKVGARMAKGAMDNLGAAWGGAFPDAPKAPGGVEAPDYPTQRVAQAFGDDTNGYRDAIASIESKGSGDYAAVGPTHPKMGRALGRYQIMESNIGPWSQEALGRTVTADEFMADPDIQDAIFDKKFKGYVDAYGPEGAAQAWIGGPGGVGKVGRKDSLGTSVGEYGKRFMGNLGGGGGQDRIQGSIGADQLGQPYSPPKPGDPIPYQPSGDIDWSRNTPDPQPVLRNLAARSVDPTDAGLQDPKLQSTVKALMRQNSMGGAPQRFQQPNATPGVSRVTEALMANGGVPQPTATPGVQRVSQALQAQNVPPTNAGRAPQRFQQPNASPGIQQIAHLIMGQQQPQQRPVQMAQAQGAPEMAGNQLVTRDAMGGPSMQMLMDAANNPWLDDNQRGYVNTLMEQQLRRQQSDYERQREMATPEYQLDLDTKRLALDKGRYEMDQARRKRNLVETKNGIYDADTGEWITNPNAPAEGDEFGLTPQLMRDEAGNYFYAQPTKDGRIVRSKVEDGAVPVNPYDKSFQNSKGKKEGEAAGEAVVSLPDKLATADYSIKLIDGMLDHPGRETATGLSGRIDPRNWVAGTDATDFNVRRKQITGRTFLEAFESLRGGGQITQIEGEKATDAMARLDTAQSDEAFFSALTELRELLELGKQRAIAKAGGGEPTGTGNIPPGAVDMLRNDPSLAEPFDAKFGTGAAARILGGQ